MHFHSIRNRIWCRKSQCILFEIGDYFYAICKKIKYFSRNLTVAEAIYDGRKIDFNSPGADEFLLNCFSLIRYVG